VGLFEPLTDRCSTRFPKRSDRLMAGDWPEEILMLIRNQLHFNSDSETDPIPAGDIAGKFVTVVA
jgi:hypothetical protein